MSINKDMVNLTQVHHTLWAQILRGKSMVDLIGGATKKKETTDYQAFVCNTPNSQAHWPRKMFMHMRKVTFVY